MQAMVFQEDTNLTGTAEQEVSLTTSHSPEEIQTLSLVLLAAAIPHTITYQPTASWEIFTDRHNHERAAYEIFAYSRENSNWPRQLSPSAEFQPIFLAMSVFIVGILALLFLHTGPWQGQSAWFAVGAADSGSILNERQYYRILTALTLHADGLHLLGNCLLGVFLLHYFFMTFGNGLGLCSLILTASTANLVNSHIHGPGHISVGFSTAIFAVIGILSSFHSLRYPAIGRIQLLMPFMAGLSLLAMLGSSGEHVDLGAHFFGLCTGLGWGYILGLPKVKLLRSNFWLQFILATLSLLAPCIAWLVAFS